MARVSSPDLATILSLAKRRVELNGWNWVSSVTDIRKDMWRLGCIKRPSLLLSRIKWTAQVSRQVGAEPRLPPRLITGNVTPSRRASAASNWGFPSEAEIIPKDESFAVGSARQPCDGLPLFQQSSIPSTPHTRLEHNAREEAAAFRTARSMRRLRGRRIQV